MGLGFRYKTSKITQVRELDLGDLEVLHEQLLEQLTQTRILEL